MQKRKSSQSAMKDKSKSRERDLRRSMQAILRAWKRLINACTSWLASKHYDLDAKVRSSSLLILKDCFTHSEMNAQSLETRQAVSQTGLQRQEFGIELLQDKSGRLQGQHPQSTQSP